MNPARPVTHREVLVSRCVAVLGAVCAVLHVPLLLAHASASLPLAAVLLVLSLGCLPCAGHLWRSPSPRTWSLTAVADSVMLLAPAALLRSAGPGSSPALSAAGHPSSAAHLSSAAQQSSAADLSSAGHPTHTTSGGSLTLPHSHAALAVLAGVTSAQPATCLTLLGNPLGRGGPVVVQVHRYFTRGRDSPVQTPGRGTPSRSR
ncbi:MAG: hypothetical protein ACRYF3_11680 [Janthinobacterium lividum]